MKRLKERHLEIVKEEVVEPHEILTMEKTRFLETILETITFSSKKGNEALMLDLDTFALKTEVDANPSIRLADLCKFKKALTKKIRIGSLMATKDKLKMYFSGCEFVATIPIVRLS